MARPFVPAGRIIDHVRNSQGFGLEDLAVLVLDEADRLLEMGFKEEVRGFWFCAWREGRFLRQGRC